MSDIEDIEDTKLPNHCYCNIKCEYGKMILKAGNRELFESCVKHFYDGCIRRVKEEKLKNLNMEDRYLITYEEAQRDCQVIGYMWMKKQHIVKFDMEDIQKNLPKYNALKIKVEVEDLSLDILRDYILHKFEEYSQTGKIRNIEVFRLDKVI